MWEKLNDLIGKRFNDFILWDYSEAGEYVYGRFTSDDDLYMIAYYKPAEKAEIFKTIKGGVIYG